MKLPTLSVNEWMEAEASLNVSSVRPENSKTSEEYAAEKGIGISAAQKKLVRMFYNGTLDRVRITNDRGSRALAYFPKKKAPPVENRNGRLSNGAVVKPRGSAKKE